MFLRLKMCKTSLKPIIKVKILHNGTITDVRALIDTGTSKPVWVGRKENIRKMSKRHITDNGIMSGFGLKPQTNCAIETIDLCIKDEKYGINFRDLPVVCAELDTGELFSLILPYTMFNKFSFRFEPAGDGCKFGEFIVDTHDSQINYHTIDNNGMVTSVFADLDDTTCKEPGIGAREVHAF